MLVYVKEGVMWLWNKCPWFIKWPIIVIMGPNLTVNALIFFVLIVPWAKSTIHAEIMPLKRERDVQIESIVREQNIRQEAIIQRLDDLHAQNKNLLEAALRNK